MKRTPIKRHGRVKPVNRKRRASEFVRPYGSKSRVGWVASLPCVVGLLCDGPTENAHTRTGGAGRKGDADSIVPLCRSHHVTLHRVGRASFERRYRLDLAAEAARVDAAWRSRDDGRTLEHSAAKAEGAA